MDQSIPFDERFERRRHRLRQRLLDPQTKRRLKRLGIQRGSRCLEIGAGHGSIARWLAKRVGRRGAVVATDMDTRFLERRGRANIEVRRHDIRSDPLELDRYDLVHCRAVLMHLGQPHMALRRLAAAVRPGGWLLVEEGDFGSFGAAKPHPGALKFNHISRTITDAWQAAGLMHPYLGRQLRELVEQLGWERCGHEGTTRIHRGGEAGARFFTMGFTEVMRDPLLRSGLLAAHDLAELNQLFLDASFSFVDYTMFAAWARRPK